MAAVLNVCPRRPHTGWITTLLNAASEGKRVLLDQAQGSAVAFKYVKPILYCQRTDRSYGALVHLSSKMRDFRRADAARILSSK